MRKLHNQKVIAQYQISVFHIPTNNLVEVQIEILDSKVKLNGLTKIHLIMNFNSVLILVEVVLFGLTMHFIPKSVIYGGPDHTRNLGKSKKD